MDPFFHRAGELITPHSFDFVKKETLREAYELLQVTKYSHLF